MAFVLGLMAVLWVTDATPLPVTALLPVILLPLLGIMTTDEVVASFSCSSSTILW